ncbi:MAG: hypothetical protein ACXVPQ_07560 [Bacteroidia bacterium]
MSSEYTKNNAEILSFVATRLLNYKRINYAILLETIKLKFPMTDAGHLLNAALIETKAAYIQNEHITLSSKEQLMKLSSGAFGLN